ncbi:MAG: hypothetical protein ACWGO1_15815, partial [Anaerolineales bacterium]
FKSALSLWEGAARQGHIESHIEIAKYYEHTLRDYTHALIWTDGAINHLNAPGTSSYLRRYWKADLQHRRQRLLRKLGMDSQDER